jgi:nitrate reductase alpha subunit
MSHFLDRLKFFKKVQSTFSNGHGVVTNEGRQWEDGYRNRWRFDKVVRSTHGVNCTGSCSWNIHVKNGLVAFEMQATDYPRTRPDMPNHEPRGCPRGASFSWYLYSPLRVKHPLIRERLVSMYRDECGTGKDPVEAWGAIQEDPKKREKYTAVRGLGGFVRVDWDEVAEIIAASNVYTAKTHGPDRIAGFSPIPAMSMISYAAGSRYLSLIGGAVLSFYDWYCDLPPASPQVWGEQTDVPESADWYNSTYLIVAGANLPMTRSPDAHFYAEVRYKGAKVIAISPDYAEYVKFADLWMPAKQGTDAAVFLAMGHVALKEFHVDNQDPYFEEYARTYTDLPMLVVLDEYEGSYVGGRFVRAADFDNSLGENNNPDWKTVVCDEKTGDIYAPNGSIGFRWGEEGKWNLVPKKGRKKAKPRLSLIFDKEEEVDVLFPDFDSGKDLGMHRNVPTKTLLLNGKKVKVATVFDLQLAQYGIDRGLGGIAATGYDDASVSNTPAWAEKITGVKQADLIRTGREFADNAAKTMGKSMVILGAGLNHWYHNDMSYRAIMNLLHLCGCVGQSGGGWAHYVGQE